MKNINFLQYAEFPMSSETLDVMQSMVLLAARLASLGGGRYILDGCFKTGNSWSAGTVVVGGEILPFQGGVELATVVVQETTSDVWVYGKKYEELYVDKLLIFGSGEDAMPWSDFVRVPSLSELAVSKAEKVQLDIHTENTPIHITADERQAWNGAACPVGSVVMWAGSVSTVPANWHPCNGDVLSGIAYPALFSILGARYGGNNMYLPDMRSQFVVGYDERDYDYNEVLRKANQDKKQHTLTLAEMPSHTHTFESKTGELLYFGSSNNSGLTNTSRMDENYVGGEIPWRAAATGGGAGHENRPPYIVMMYIIKIQ